MYGIFAAGEREFDKETHLSSGQRYTKVCHNIKLDRRRHRLGFQNMFWSDENHFRLVCV